MNENTANKSNPKVKAWSRDSVHTEYRNAADRAADIKGDHKSVKIRKQARGYVVKYWDGHYQDAPPPKPKKSPAEVTL